MEDLAAVYRGLTVAAMRGADVTVERGAYFGGFTPSDGHSLSAFVVMVRRDDGTVMLIDEHTEGK